jgi:predicted nucleotide-binding protein
MDFRAGASILGELEQARQRCRCGVFLFTEDDPLKGAADTAAPRDNVVFEAGFFISAKGAERCLIIRQGESKMPADLGGGIYVELERGAGVESIEGRLASFLHTSL